LRNVRTLNPALLALGGLGVATALALLAPLGWPFELFAHFRPQYAVAALLVALLLVGRRQGVAAGIAVVLASWNALPVVQRTQAESRPTSCTGPAFTVATVNLQYSNTRHERFLAWLAQHPADLVVVQEVTEAWVDTLADSKDHPHRYLLTREDPYGIGVLSRWPLESMRTIDLAGRSRASSRSRGSGFESSACIRTGRCCPNSRDCGTSPCSRPPVPPAAPTCR
jgi:endonuclease/exonuclease/phosphatase (EEP) superfamily protein YafD